MFLLLKKTQNKCKYMTHPSLGDEQEVISRGRLRDYTYFIFCDDEQLIGNYIYRSGGFLLTHGPFYPGMTD